MRGSLNDPPIVIGISRIRVFIVPVIAAAIGFLLPVGLRGSLKLSIFTALFFFALGLCYCVWQLVRPGCLTLAPEGLTWGSGAKARSWRWQDFDYFQVRPFFGMNVPACRFSSLYNGPLRNMAGGQGMFLGAWEIPGKDVVALLEDARVRWGRSGPWDA
jgi:hypothetical protein